MLTQARLKELLSYEPDTGDFARLVSSCGRVKVGDIAGHVDTNGYTKIKVEGKGYAAHRLAFLFMEGYFPEHGVDHKNKIKHDNRWENLRHATNSCNGQNREISNNSTSGFPGVSFFKQTKMWKAHVKLNRKTIHLGYYTDILEAALARYTFEQQCEHWSCVQDSELVKAIKKAWPEFNDSHTLLLLLILNFLA